MPRRVRLLTTNDIMSVFLLIASIIVWAASVWVLPSRPLFSPALSYLGLLGISFCNFPTIEIPDSMLISWLCITVVVMMATILQPASINRQARGMAYIIGGAFVGLAIGLLGFTVSTAITGYYAIMIVAVAVGIFFGFLLYSNTPDGRAIGVMSGNFFRYLMAKGFPSAVTVMQIGLVFVLLISSTR